jgi:hypothetical protein
MHAATELVELQRLRARVDGLAHRRFAAEANLGPRLASPSLRQLEAMKAELSELRWQLTDLEAMIRA